MKIMWKILLLVCIVAILSGCVATSSYTTDPRQTTFSREDILKMPDIQFPANYNTDNLKNLKMGVAVKKLEGKAISPKGAVEELDIDPELSGRLQGQFAELKRFTVYSVHNRDGVDYFEQLGDLGEVSKKESKTMQPDYILNLMVTIKKERHTRAGLNGEAVYVVAECDANCVDLDSNLVYFSEKARGREWYEKKSGFDASEPTKLKSAIDMSAKKAILEMVNKLGNYFPVGGRVLDVTPTGRQMTLDCGVNRGVGEGQQLVVFIRDQEVDIPLALAEAEAGKDECTLDVYKWNEDDPDAQIHIQRYKKNPSTFCSENQIFAVGYGLPPSKKMEY